MGTKDIARETNASMRTVQRVYRQIEAGIGIKKVSGGGRKRKLDPRQVAGLTRSIKAKPNVSLRKHAKRLNVSHTAINSLVKEEGFKSYRRQRQPLLTSAMKERRLDRCKMVINMLKKGGKPIVIFSDEKNFVVDAKSNCQNDPSPGKRQRRGRGWRQQWNKGQK